MITDYDFYAQNKIEMAYRNIVAYLTFPGIDYVIRYEQAPMSYPKKTHDNTVVLENRQQCYERGMASRNLLERSFNRLALSICCLLQSLHQFLRLVHQRIMLHNVSTSSVTHYASLFPIRQQKC